MLIPAEETIFFFKGMSFVFWPTSDVAVPVSAAFDLSSGLFADDATEPTFLSSTCKSPLTLRKSGLTTCTFFTIIAESRPYRINCRSGTLTVPKWNCDSASHISIIRHLLYRYQQYQF